MFPLGVFQWMRPSGVIWTQSFQTTSAGNLGTLSSYGSKALTLTRASAATVQTSASTIDTTPGVDQARVGNVGAAWDNGLLVEGSISNSFTQSNGSNWTTNGTATKTTGFATGPDGTLSGCRCQKTAAGTGYVQLNSVTTSTSNRVSYWIKSTSGNTAWQQTEQLSGTALQAEAYSITNSWARYTVSVSNPTVGFGPLVADGNNRTTSGGVDYSTTALDALVAYAQWEPANKFPTSAIVTTGASATRSPDLLASNIVPADSGDLGLEIYLVVLGALTDYPADPMIFYFNANVYASFSASTTKLTIGLSTGSVTSASGVTLNPGDVLNLFIRWTPTTGGTRADYRRSTDGGLSWSAATSLISGATAAASFPSSNVQILNSASGQNFSGYLLEATAYAKGVSPFWVT
ncbi:MAG TPA: hypothetical protein VI159_09395 [Gemmatimonadales bacterium]